MTSTNAEWFERAKRVVPGGVHLGADDGRR